MMFQSADTKNTVWHGLSFISGFFSTWLTLF